MKPAVLRGGPHLFIGLLFVGWGVLQLLDTLGLMEFRDAFRTYWPVVLVAWGGWNLLTGHHVVERLFGAGLIVLGGILLGNRLYGWGVNLFALWPLLLIALGLRIILGGGRHRRWHHQHLRDRHRRRFEARYGGPVTFEATATEAGGDASGPAAATVDDGAATQSQGAGAWTDDTSATIREFACLGGVERRNTSQAFRGGEATALLGGIELDLRECRMADSEARIEVFACMGGISVHIPRNWTVQSEVAAILGGFHDQSTPPVDGNARRLIISGQAVMGGIEVTN